MYPQGLNEVPMPFEIYYPSDYDDKRFLARAWTYLKFVWWPKRCHVSGKWLWFTFAYRADYVITGPGDPAVWTRWYSSTEFLLLKLKYPHENDYA
jgi:hypothetical protein